MNPVFVLLAQVDPKELGSYWQRSNISKAGLGTLITAISFVTLLILIWAIFIRKQGGERPRRYRYPRPNAEPLAKTEVNGGAGSHSGRKRRRRREHRPRKPTLSQTGGLPPVREDVPSDDPP
jgi:hypothetical protein